MHPDPTPIYSGSEYDWMLDYVDPTRGLKRYIGVWDPMSTPPEANPYDLEAID